MLIPGIPDINYFKLQKTDETYYLKIFINHVFSGSEDNNFEGLDKAVVLYEGAFVDAIYLTLHLWHKLESLKLSRQTFEAMKKVKILRDKKGEFFNLVASIPLKNTPLSDNGKVMRDGALDAIVLMPVKLFVRGAAESLKENPTINLGSYVEYYKNKFIKKWKKAYKNLSKNI